MQLSSYQYKDLMIPMLKIRQSRDHLIFNMEILIPGKDGLILRWGPGVFLDHGFCLKLEHFRFHR